VAGQKDRIAGKAKELQGKLTGDADKESEGKAQNAEGKLEKRAEDVIDRTKGAVRAAKNKLPGR
jgi:uncharacterized protein YjbJ (UPF0337 family)